MTLGNYHLTCHVFDHVTSRQLWDHVIYEHVILGKYHMTYQGIGHQHDQVTTRSPDRTHFRRTPSPLIGMWKTVGTINESTNQ